MSPKRLSVLLLPALAIAALWWFLRDPGRETDPTPDPTASESTRTEKGEPAETAKTDAHDSSGKQAAESAAEPRREAVAAERAGPALTGRVVDDRGRPIGNAEVLCRATPSLAALGTGGFPGKLDTTRILKEMKKVRDATESVRTKSDGGFRVFAPEGEGTLDFEVRARGHVVLKRVPSRPKASDLDLGELTLQRAAVIAGRVVDAAGGPIAGARVRRSKGGFGDQFEDMEIAGISELMDMDTGRGGVKTGTDGRFEIAHAAPGKFRLRATHPDYPPTSSEEHTVAAGDVVEDIRMSMTVGAQIAGVISGVPGGASSIRVLAREQKAKTKNNPLAAFGFDATEIMGAMGLAMGDRTTMLTADGKFVLTGLKPNAKYKVWAVHEGAGMLQMNACTDPAVVLGGALGVELSYAQGVTVTMAVVDAKNRPITRLRVKPKMVGGRGGFFGAALAEAMGSRATFQEYPGGRVTISNLRPREKQALDLEVEALGHSSFAKKKITMPKTGTVDLGTVRLASAPVLTVLVTDARNGAPIPGAKVSIQLDGDRSSNTPRIRTKMFVGDQERSTTLNTSTRSGRTDAKGRCVLNSYAGKPVIVEVESEGRAPYASKPFVAPKTDGDHEAVLLIGGRVAVTVLDADKTPLVETMVERRGPGGKETVRSDAEGIAQFRNLAPGTHRFRLGGEGGDGSRGGFSFNLNVGSGGPQKAEDKDKDKDNPWKEVTVADERESALTLTRFGFGSLRGIVRENGEPLKGAKVAFVAGTKDKDGSGTEELAGLTDKIEEMMGGGGSGRTAKSGRYRLKKVPVGDHRLRITHKDRLMPTIVPVHLELGKNTFDIDLRTTSLAGRVIGPDGEPIDGATVTVSSATSRMGGQANELMRGATAILGADFGLKLGGKDIKTDDDGRFELRGLRPDATLHVHVRASGFSRSATKVKLRDGEMRQGFDVRLTEGGRIRVKVTGKVPLFGAIAAVPVGRPEATPVIGMLKNGKCTLKGLKPGKWSVAMSGVGGSGVGGDEKLPSKQVTVVAGESVLVELEVPK